MKKPKPGKHGRWKRPGPPFKHGITAMVKRGELPREFRAIHKPMKVLRIGLAEDLGGEANLTTAQRVMITQASKFWGMLLLQERYIREKNLLSIDRAPAYFLHDLFQRYLQTDKRLTGILESLGLERRQVGPGALTLEALDIMVQKESEVEQESGSDQDPEESGQTPDQNIDLNPSLGISGGLPEVDPGPGKGPEGSPRRSDPGAKSDSDGSDLIDSLIEGDKR